MLFHNFSVLHRLCRYLLFLLKLFIPLTPKSAKHQISRKTQIIFCKILKNKWYHANVLPKRFHLNGHTMGFRQQTQKLKLHQVSIIESGSERVVTVSRFLRYEDYFVLCQTWLQFKYWLQSLMVIGQEKKKMNFLAKR